MIVPSAGHTFKDAFAADGPLLGITDEETVRYNLQTAELRRTRKLEYGATYRERKATEKKEAATLLAAQLAPATIISVAAPALPVESVSEDVGISGICSSLQAPASKPRKGPTIRQGARLPLATSTNTVIKKKRKSAQLDDGNVGETQYKRAKGMPRSLRNGALEVSEMTW